MKRRYAVGLHNIYDTEYDTQYKFSQILAAEHGRTTALSINIYDKRSIQGHILTLKGDGDSGKFYYAEGQQYRDAAIPQQKLVFAEIAEKFADYQQKEVDEGKAKPTQMPPEMQAKQYKAEAAEDILKGELEFLEKRLKTLFSDKEEKISANLVLKDGSPGISKLLDGQIVILDGQQCSKNGEGVPIISDERSQYCGMSTSKYFEHIARPWLKQRDKLRNEQRQKLKMKKILPEDYRQNVRPALLPWPEGVKNHLKK